MGKKQKDRAFSQRTLYAAMSAAGVVNGEASATYANYDGLGEALIFPYYTMRDPNHGGLVIAHDFIRGKLLEEQAQVERVVYRPPTQAVKIRYLSGPRATPNTDEVLDFNLFLSPADPWLGGVIPLPLTEPAALSQMAASSVGTDWVIHMMHPGLLVGEARIREGYVELVEMGSSRHLGQYPQDLRQMALFGLQTLPCDDREEFLRNISQSAVIVDPDGGIVEPSGGNVQHFRVLCQCAGYPYFFTVLLTDLYSGAILRLSLTTEELL